MWKRGIPSSTRRHLSDPTTEPSGRRLAVSSAGLIRIAALVALFGEAALFSVAPAAAIPRPRLLWWIRANGSMQAIVSTPDIDGDGGPDVAFEGYENGPSGVDHVFAVRGASADSAEVLWSARPIGGLSSGGGWGNNCLRLGPDLNGDQFPDLLLGTAWGGRTAYALNTLSGATLWSFDTYAYYDQATAGWIYAMDSLGEDLTEDGVPEIVFCSGSENNRIHCVDGATGAFVWAYYGGDAFTDLRSCQDIDDDGIRDVVACLGDNTPISPRVIALSGADGAFIWERPVQATLWNLAFIDDIDHDGIRDLVPAQWGTSLYCLSGRTGEVLWTRTVGAQQRVATLDDVNQDGLEDILVGLFQSSVARVVSGADGTILWTTPTADWTWAVDRVADCTGDGVNDAAVGDFDGWVYLMDGVTGQVFWSWRNPTADKIMVIRGVPDLNGNGAPDVVAGTQLLYGGTGGYVYALEGNSEATAVPDGGPLAAGRLSLSAPYPNPSSGPFLWTVAAATSGPLRLQLFGPDGRQVREIGPVELTAGTPLRLAWDGRDGGGARVPAGIYQARVLMSGGRTAGSSVAVIR